MPSPIVKKFGETLRIKREEMGMSQEELANKVGVHHTYIGMIERVEKNLILDSMSKIAKALGISISELLEGL